MNALRQRAEMASELRRTLGARRTSARTVDRRRGVGAEEFLDRYYAANHPVILTDLMDGWKAKSAWSPSYFERILGPVEVELSIGRNTEADCNRNFKRVAQTRTMAEVVDLITNAGETNDVYMISNNRNMERPELQVLLADIAPDPAIFDATKTQFHTCLWFGPAGTVTPLHHDQNNNMFCQLYGRKRVRLISPDETELLADAEDFYSPVSLDAPDYARFPWLAEVTVKEVILEPGEALFIPVGWWHDVRSLEVSINLSLMNFREANQFGWYCPGNCHGARDPG
jgi:hypothetical protein